MAGHIQKQFIVGCVDLVGEGPACTPALRCSELTDRRFIAVFLANTTITTKLHRIDHIGAVLEITQVAPSVMTVSNRF